MALKHAFLALILLPALAAAHTRIYSYVDDTGTRHFTDMPDDNRYRLLIVRPQDRTRSGDHYDSQWLVRAKQFDAIIERAANSAQIESNLLRAVITVESGFNARAVSKCGAMGLMQLMPATASRFGALNPYDPRENVYAGALYLKFLMNRFGQNMRLALAAYNAGEAAVDRNGGRIPPYAETLQYVPRVLKIYQTLVQNPPRGVVPLRLSAALP
jgi:soluble lytic murein transglycosylase-like protein